MTTGGSLRSLSSNGRDSANVPLGEFDLLEIDVVRLHSRRQGVRGSGRLYLLLLLGLAAVDADGSEDEAPIAPSVLKEDAADDADADASALDTSG